MSVVPAMIIVFNPVAGRRRANLLWRVLDVLVANGVRLDIAETHRAGHAEALAREAVQRGEPMVVAAGGDGTIAEVANGLMGSGARLGVIPLGTANVLAHELGLPFAPKAVAAALAFGRTCTRPRYVLFDRPALMPFETIVLRVFFPTWIIFVPVSAC